MKLLKHAHVYAPEDRGVCDLLIGNGKILALAKVLDDQHVKMIFPDVEIIDLSGKSVIPGIVDPHVHIIGCGISEAFSCDRRAGTDHGELGRQRNTANLE